MDRERVNFAMLRMSSLFMRFEWRFSTVACKYNVDLSSQLVVHRTLHSRVGHKRRHRAQGAVPVIRPTEDFGPEFATASSAP